MRHAWLRAQQSAWLDGTLPPRRRARLERHLAACQPCRRELRELERTVRLLRELPALEIDAELAGRVTADVAERTLASPPPPGLARWLAPVAAASAVLLVLGAVQGIEVSLSWPPGLAGSDASAPVEARVAREAGPAPQGAGARPLVAFQAEQHPQVAAPVREPSRREPAAALQRPLPPMASCLGAGPSAGPECAGWHAWLVGLAARDPSVFIVEMESLPAGVRERWLGELSDFAAHAGAASLLAEELRASGDPRASSLAPRFERTTALATRR